MGLLEELAEALNGDVNLFRIKTTTGGEVSYGPEYDFAGLRGFLGGLVFVYDDYEPGKEMKDDDDATWTDEIEIKVDGEWKPVTWDECVARSDEWVNYTLS